MFCIGWGCNVQIPTFRHAGWKVNNQPIRLQLCMLTEIDNFVSNVMFNCIVILQVVALVARNPTKLQEAAHKHNVEITATDIDEVLKRDDVQLVVNFNIVFEIYCILVQS